MEACVCVCVCVCVYVYISSLQLLSHIWLCKPVDCSMPGFPVHHQLPELTQTHVHRISDAIQPSHTHSVIPFSPCLQSFPASQSFQMSQFFASGGQVLELQLQPQYFQWIFRTDFLYSWLVWSSCSPRGSQESSLTPQCKNISSLVLSFLYCPILTSIHDYWKNHNFD